jgi:DNA-binding transcriptional ArsR family regulator
MSTMDPLRILTGEEAIDAVHALNDENRRRILHALRARRLSASELCKFLNDCNDKEVKPQTVRYHLKELERSKLIEQDGYEPAGNGDTHIMKKLWRATAETVFIATGDLDGMPETKGIQKSLDIVGTMRQLGFEMSDEKGLEKLAKEFVERDNLWTKGREFAKETLKVVPEIDPSLYIRFRRILSVVQLNETEYERYWELSRSVTDLLRESYKAGLGKNPEVI